MTTRTVNINFEPRDWQKEAISNLERFNVFVIHRRAGKTFLCIHLLIRELFNCKKKFPVVGIISPEKQQSIKNTWKIIKEIVSVIPGVTTNEVENKVTFPNGGELLLFGAANPDAIRGGYFDMVVLDEVAQMPSSLWQEVIRPMLSDREGKAIFIGTPKGRNLFYDIYKHSTSGAKDWYGSLYNVEDTKEISKRELESLRQDQTEDAYNQEYMCDFDAAIKGAYYAKEIVRLRKEGKIKKGLYDPDYPVSVGFDIGLDGTALWYAQIFGKDINLIDFDMVTNEDMDWVIKNFLKRKDYTYDFMYVPHDASRTTAADKRKSTSILLRNHKYKVKRVKKPGNNKLDSEISLVKTNIRRCSFDSEKCAKGLDHLTLYQQQWNDNVGMFMGTPRHDIHSHPADSFRTLIMGAREHIKKTGNTATSVQTVHQYDPYGAPAKVVVEDYNPFNI